MAMLRWSFRQVCCVVGSCGLVVRQDASPPGRPNFFLFIFTLFLTLFNSVWEALLIARTAGCFFWALFLLGLYSGLGGINSFQQFLEWILWNTDLLRIWFSYCPCLFDHPKATFSLLVWDKTFCIPFGLAAEMACLDYGLMCVLTPPRVTGSSCRIPSFDTPFTFYLPAEML